MSDNPYASPAYTPDMLPQIVPDKGLPTASQGKRFLNCIIDNIVLQVLSGVAGFVVGVIIASAQIADHGSVTQQDEGQLQAVGFVVGLVVALGYYTLMEALFQKTVGKFLTGTMVVNENGERPSFGQCVGRSFARFIPFEAFSFLGGSQPVGWHDSLSGTKVVSLK